MQIFAQVLIYSQLVTDMLLTGSGGAHCCDPCVCLYWETSPWILT